MSDIGSRATRRRPLTILGAAVLTLGSLTAPASAAGAAEPAAERFAVTYPTTSGPAAAQVEEGFDIDVEASRSGTLKADIRPVGRSGGGWIPLTLATELPNQAVRPGAVTAVAEPPVEASPGDYTVRVSLVADDGQVVARDRVRSGVTIEDHGLPTGFESSDGTAWTDFEQEQSFIADLESASPRAAVSVLGESVNGLPYNLLRIGSPSPPALADIEGDAVLLVCSQHGDEPSGREACLQEARRLSLTSDTRTRDYLADNTVLVVPSANPDGSMADTRENAHGVDLNRDHLRLEEPETRMLAEVMRDARPETVHDLHEMGGQDRPDLEVVWGRHLGIDEEVRAFGEAWGDDLVRPRTEAAGYSTGPYLANPGTGENMTLTNASMFRELNGVISETNTSVLAGETTQTSQLRRVEVQRITIGETLRQQGFQKERMVEAAANAKRRNIDMGYTQQGPYFFTGNSESPDPPLPSDYIMRVPCGYLLTEAQVAHRAVWTELWDVRTQPTSEAAYEAFVPMWQAPSSVIPLMMDDRAAGSNDIRATPVDDCGDL
ncbi:MAG: hypothetical protein GEV10_16220 [Streptosporangiales bacterium]|nr:hypothetical protein [Streptosporangiales bacterium]